MFLEKHKYCWHCGTQDSLKRTVDKKLRLITDKCSVCYETKDLTNAGYIFYSCMTTIAGIAMCTRRKNRTS